MGSETPTEAGYKEELPRVLCGEQREFPAEAIPLAQGSPAVSTWTGPGRAGAEWEIPGRGPGKGVQGSPRPLCQARPGHQALLLQPRGPRGLLQLSTPAPPAAWHPSRGPEGGASPGTGSPGARHPTPDQSAASPQGAPGDKSVVAGGLRPGPQAGRPGPQGWVRARPKPGSQESDRRPPLAGAGSVSGQAAQVVVTSQGAGRLAGEQESKRRSSVREGSAAQGVRRQQKRRRLCTANPK